MRDTGVIRIPSLFSSHLSSPTQFLALLSSHFSSACATPLRASGYVQLLSKCIPSLRIQKIFIENVRMNALEVNETITSLDFMMRREMITVFKVSPK